jgi:hypothetical protein
VRLVHRGLHLLNDNRPRARCFGRRGSRGNRCCQECSNGAGTFGNAGRNNIIGPLFKNFDFVLSRTLNLGGIREGLSMQWRAEFFNAFNHPNFNTPVQTVDNPSFAAITSASDPRQMQFGLKIKF